MVGAHRHVPADLDRPRHDRFAEVRAGRPERRSRDLERAAPRGARLHRGRGDRVHERVVAEELALALHPALRARDVALRIVVVPGALNLIEAQPDQSECRASSVDRGRGGQGDRPCDAVADPRRSVERDRAGDGAAVARAEELIRCDGMERVAALETGERRAVQGVERRRRRSAVRPDALQRIQVAEVERERHRWNLRLM